LGLAANAFIVWFAGRLTLARRVVLTAMLLLLPMNLLYVWSRLNPRPYFGTYALRLGLLPSAGAVDVIEGG